MQGAFAEPGVPVTDLAPDVVSELRAMAGWLGLERVGFGERGDLASPLRGVAGHYAAV